MPRQVCSFRSTQYSPKKIYTKWKLKQRARETLFVLVGWWGGGAAKFSGSSEVAQHWILSPTESKCISDCVRSSSSGGRAFYENHISFNPHTHTHIKLTPFIQSTRILTTFVLRGIRVCLNIAHSFILQRKIEIMSGWFFFFFLFLYCCASTRQPSIVIILFLIGCDREWEISEDWDRDFEKKTTCCRLRWTQTVYNERNISSKYIYLWDIPLQFDGRFSPHSILVVKILRSH